MTDDKNKKNSQIDSIFDFGTDNGENRSASDGFYDELDDFSFERTVSKSFLYEDDPEEELSFSNGVFGDGESIEDDIVQEENQERKELPADGLDTSIKEESFDVVEEEEKSAESDVKKNTHFSVIMPVLERNRRKKEQIIKSDESAFETDTIDDFDSDFDENDGIFGEDDDELSVDISVEIPLVDEPAEEDLETVDVSDCDSSSDDENIDEITDEIEVEDADETEISETAVASEGSVNVDTEIAEDAFETTAEIDIEDESVPDEKTELYMDDFDNDFDDVDDLIEEDISAENDDTINAESPVITNANHVMLFKENITVNDADDSSENDEVIILDHSAEKETGEVELSREENHSEKVVPGDSQEEKSLPSTPSPKKKQPQSDIAKRKAARAKQRKKRKKRKKLVKDVIKESFSWVSLVIAAFVVAFFVNLYIARPSIVSGSSMMPTLNNGDTVIISQIPYMLGEPQYGDIVVIDRNTERERTFAVEVRESLKYNALTQSLFSENELHEDVFWIKRIVGLPGDVIEFKDGMFIRNGMVIQEDYILTEDVNTYIDGSYCVVEEGCVFVMGDNRNGSHDSRFLTEQIELDHIVGKLISK